MKHLDTVPSNRGHKSMDYIVRLSESEFEVLRELVSGVKTTKHRSTYINLRRSIINTKKSK